MKEKGTESLKKTTLSQEVLQAAGCPEETIRKILQEKSDRCQCRCLRQYRKELLPISTGSRKNSPMWIISCTIWRKDNKRTLMNKERRKHHGKKHSDQSGKEGTGHELSGSGGYPGDFGQLLYGASGGRLFPCGGSEPAGSIGSGPGGPGTAHLAEQLDAVRYELEVLDGIPLDLDSAREAAGALYRNSRIYSAQALLPMEKLRKKQTTGVLYYRVRAFDLDGRPLGIIPRL
mgnify:CR=1 FL=1